MELILTPKFLPGGSIQTRKHSAHAQRDDFAVRHRGRTARPGKAGGGRVCAQGFIFVLPEFLAGAGFEAADDFIALLPGENEELVAYQGGRGDALADGDLPFLRQLLWPGLGGLEVSGFYVPIGTAPLGPILREGAVCTGRGDATQD